MLHASLASKQAVMGSKSSRLHRRKTQHTLQLNKPSTAHA